ncbi:MAG: HAMP domain-containing sensor histidine kinase [Saprospiraceae bacterium]
MRRTIAYLSLIVGIITVVLNLTSIHFGQKQCEKMLQTDLTAAESLLNKFVKGDTYTELDPLDNSYFYIEAFDHDSLVYWNTPPNTRDEVEHLRALQQSQRSANIHLNFGTTIHTLFHCFNVSKASDSSNHAFSLTGKKYHFHTTNTKLLAWISTFGWISFLVFLTLIFVSPAYDNFNKIGLKKFIFIAILPLLILLFLGHITPFYKLFEGFFGYEIFNSEIVSKFSLADFFLLLYIGILVLLAIQKEPTVLSIFENSKYIKSVQILVGLLIGVGFGKIDSIIRGFVVNSDTNLEIEYMLQFDFLSLIIVVLILTTIFLFFIITHYLISRNETTDYKSISLGWTIGISIAYIFELVGIPFLFYIGIVIAYTLILDAYVDKGKPNITFLLWWIILFSVFGSITMYYYGIRKDVEGREKFVKQLYRHSDQNIVKNIEQYNQHLIQTASFEKISSIQYPAKLDADDLKSFLQDTTLKTLFDTFNFNIEIFDFKAKTMLSNHFSNFESIQNLYNTSYSVGKGVKFQPFSQSYILKYDIANSNSLSHFYTLFIIFKGKNHQEKIENSNKYSFVIMNKDGIIKRNDVSGIIPSVSLLMDVDSTMVKQNFSFVVFKPNDEYKIIAYRKISTLLKPISLFSFIFSIFGVMILFITILNTKYTFLPSTYALRFGNRSSLKTKIQLSIIGLILLGFLIIGVITGYYFKNLMEVNQNQNNGQTATNIISNIQSDINQLSEDADIQKFISLKVSEYSQIHNKPLTVYNTDGALVGYSSEENIPVRLSWDKCANPSMHSFRFHNLDVYPISYDSTMPESYIGIVKTANTGAMINILDFMSTILNAYIFLFLIAGALAITITNSITQPLSILTEKLKGFKLGKKNEQLEWNSNDEIGILIKNYNNLTDQLEKSATILAKTERDMAWREMAKQVAHEIKNPLTPMKLSIQYLEKSSQSNPERASQLIPRISNTLIEQIDNLTQIANEFSNFATMPTANNEKVALNDIVEAVHDLFRKREDMDINMIEPIDELYAFADKNHLVRILNNLLKNAIQAIPENRRGKIEIELTREHNNAVIRISDNGTGIPDHMKEKVFTPNFTTKSSGTGLGLAICANMIESFNGKIYFETTLNKGTDFYISIPLMRSEENYEGSEQRISLD